MKKTTWIGCSLSLFLLIATGASASWLIDPFKFSAAVHGEMSCQECHENISDKDLHPDPANVNMKLSEFFSTDMCAGCHNEVLESINDGSHGEKPVNNPAGWQNCIACHNPHYELPPGQKSSADLSDFRPEFSEEDQACMKCHGIIETDDPETRDPVAAFCFHCHAANETESSHLTGKSVALIDTDAYQRVPHADLNCLTCHPKAPGFEHNAQITSDCSECHPPHDEKITHDLHANVACQSCHLQDIIPVKDPDTGLVLWKSKRILDAALKIHEMIRTDDTENCRACHSRDNTVGAPAMVLPAKSLICMPCHPATFSIGDTTTILSLCIFFLGILSLFAYILSGTLPESNESGLIPKFFLFVGKGVKAVFSSKIVVIARSLVGDVLLQQRLFKQSVSRWLIHSLIFLPFVFRFFWGLAALLTSLLKPDNHLLRFMLDKNHPATGFLFDLTGIMILAGIVLAFIRGIRRLERPQGLPDQDRVALLLIGGIVMIGFVLEGLRIAMTGFPDGSSYAFIGFSIGKIFGGFSNVNNFYGYIWYLHAITTGVFIAYLPFSQLLHIIMAPFILAMNAIRKHEHQAD